MNGWQTKTIGEVCDVIGGGTPDTKRTENYDGDIPWVTVRDMNTDIIECTERSITKKGLQSSASNLISAGNVIIATRVGLGKVCKLAVDSAINQDVKAVIPCDRKILNVDYLYWWFRSMAPVILAEGRGATVLGVKLPFVKSLKIPLPPLSEQKRIVMILDEAFGGIAKATANAQRNLANAQELFSSRLSKVFSEASNVGGTARLGDYVTRLTNGYVGPTRNIYLERGIPYLLARHVKNNQLDFDGQTYISSEFNLKNKKSILKEGDVLLVQSGHIGHAAVVSKEHEGHNCHAMIVITPKNGLLGDYLSLFFQFELLRGAFEEIRSGSTVPHLTCKLVKEILIPLPKISKQEEIILEMQSAQNDLQKLLAVYQEKSVCLQDLKQSLLHKAFTGQLTSSSVVPAVQKLESPMTANAKLTAQVIVLAHHRHAVAQRDKTYGHVKAQKILHLVESCANISLARSPIKDAAGPNDFVHMLRAEEWAESNGFFKFNQRDGGYSFQKLKGYNQLLSEAQERLKPFKQKLDNILGLLVPMDTQEAEVFATVHAAWNNLVVDRKPITDDAIIKEARDDWHSEKLKIPKEKFLKAIRLIRKEGMIPDGSAKYVQSHQQGKLLFKLETREELVDAQLRFADRGDAAV